MNTPNDSPRPPLSAIQALWQAFRALLDLYDSRQNEIQDAKGALDVMHGLVRQFGERMTCDEEATNYRWGCAQLAIREAARLPPEPPEPTFWLVERRDGAYWSNTSLTPGAGNATSFRTYADALRRYLQLNSPEQQTSPARTVYRIVPVLEIK